MIYFDPEPIQNKSLIYNFFVAFNILEYSLKELDLVHHDRGMLIIEWDNFVDRRIPDFDNVEELPDEIRAPVAYLFENPPRKQKIRDEDVRWIDTYQGRTNPTKGGCSGF